jgi:hypothetical protein
LLLYDHIHGGPLAREKAVLPGLIRINRHLRPCFPDNKFAAMQHLCITFGFREVDLHYRKKGRC